MWVMSNDLSDFESHELHFLLHRKLQLMNEIKGNNIYCGPAAIAAIVGCNTDTAESYIQTYRSNYMKVKGTTNQEIIETFKLLGYEAESLPLVEDGSLFGAIPYLNEGTYLFNLPEHYVVIDVSPTRLVTIIDNHTKTPIKLAASSRLSQNVVHCWKVTKVREVKPKEITYSRRKITIQMELDIRDFPNGDPTSHVNFGNWIRGNMLAVCGTKYHTTFVDVAVINTPDE